MSKVTCVSQAITSYQGVQTALTMKIFVHNTFIPSTLEVDMSGVVKKPTTQFYLDVPCSIEGTIVTAEPWIIDSTTDSLWDPDGTFYSFALFNTEAEGGDFVQLIMTGIRVPPITPTHLATLAIFSQEEPVDLPPEYLTADQVADLIQAAISALNLGVVVNTSDPVWQGIIQSKWLRSYSSLANAISVIGSSVVELIVTDNVTISANTSIPSTIRLKIQGNGAFTVNTGITLTIGNMPDAPIKQIFFTSGTAKVLFGKNATGGNFRIEWWAGVQNATNVTAFAQQAMESITNNYGGRLIFGLGNWTIKELDMPNYAQVIGFGNGVFDGVFTQDGTRLRLPTGSGSTYILGIKGVTRNNYIEGVCLDSTPNPDGQSLFIQGSLVSASAQSGIKTSRVAYQSLNIAYYMKFTGLVEQIIGIQSDNDIFQIGEDAVAIQCETVNTQNIFNNPRFQMETGSTAFKILAIGMTQVNNPIFEGNQGSPPEIATPARTIISATMMSGSKVMTINGGEFWLRQEMGQKVTINSETFLVTKFLSAFQAEMNVTATTNHIAQGVTISYFSPDPILPFACFHVQGNYDNINIINSADEGIAYFLVKEDQHDVPITIQSSFIQSHIWMKFLTNITSIGNDYYSLCYKSTAFDPCYVNSIGDNVKRPAFGGATLATPQLMVGNNNPGFVLNEFGLNNPFNWLTDPQTNQLMQDVNVGTRFNYNTPQWSSLDVDYQDNAIVQIGAVKPATGDIKEQFRIGELNETTLLLQWWYAFFRNPTSGYLQFQGNQTGFIGYEFDQPPYAPNFIGEEVTPTILGTSTVLYSVPDREYYCRMSASTPVAVGGITFGGPLGSRPAETHLVVNISANTITFLNENAGTPAIYRFLTTGGGSVALAQNQMAFLIYDGALTRWRIAVL